MVIEDKAAYLLLTGQAEGKEVLDQIRKEAARTPEARQKMVQATKGNSRRLGKKHTLESCVKMGQTRMGYQNAKGHVLSEEWKKEHSARLKGRSWRINPNTGKREWI